MIDLHTHSTASDGTLTPTELVNNALRLKVSAIALTDHDTILGISEGLMAAQGKKLLFIPGIELSTYIENEKGSLHLLGLFIDHESTDLNNTINALIAMRNERNHQMIANLAKLNMPLELAEIEREAKGGGVIGRPHFARAMLKKGYIKNLEEAYRRYLGRGGSVYVSKQKLERKRAIELIRNAKGVPILAHPSQTYLDGTQLERLICELKDYGLEGIEAYYPGYKKNQIKRYRALAKKYDLVISGGSDFHGDAKPWIKLGTGNGQLRVPNKLLLEIKNRADDIARQRAT